MTGNDVRNARLSVGITQEGLSVLLQVGLRTVERYEKMDSLPRVVALAMAALFQALALERALVTCNEVSALLARCDKPNALSDMITPAKAEIESV